MDKQKARSIVIETFKEVERAQGAYALPESFIVARKLLGGGESKEMHDLYDIAMKEMENEDSND